MAKETGEVKRHAGARGPTPARAPPALEGTRAHAAPFHSALSCLRCLPGGSSFRLAPKSGLYPRGLTGPAAEEVEGKTSSESERSKGSHMRIKDGVSAASTGPPAPSRPFRHLTCRTGTGLSSESQTQGSCLWPLRMGPRGTTA